jgi:IPT/TIG domain
MKMSRVIVLSSLFFWPAFASAAEQAADPAGPITLAESKVYTATSTKEQHISDSINLQNGQDKLHLTLTYYNGSESTPPFKWIRIASPSMNYVTEAQFDGKKVLPIDVTGELSDAGNQILVTGAGPTGASFSWKLTTPQPRVSAANPDTVETGSHIVITGHNFCPEISDDSVSVNGQNFEITAATPHNLVVKIPQQFKSGPTEAKVKVAGMDAGTVKFTVSALPYLKSVNTAWVAAGAPFTIYGDNFSTDKSAVKVYVGAYPCNIVSATADSITAVSPLIYIEKPMGFYQPVKVQVNGVKASNQLTISTSGNL